MCPQLRLFVLESDGALTKEWVDRVTGGAWDVAQVEMERERVGGVGGEGWRDGGMEVCVYVCVWRALSQRYTMGPILKQAHPRPYL